MNKKDELMLADETFIQHIESHLKKGEEVVCKICGKTANSIVAKAIRNTPSPTES